MRERESEREGDRELLSCKMVEEEREREGQTRPTVRRHNLSI